MKKLSIIGFGRFGKTLHRLFSDDFEITIYDKNPKVLKDFSKDRFKVVPSLEEVYESDIIVYAVPISSFEEVIRSHKKYIEKRHTLIDVLSVKEYPKKVFTEHLEDQCEDVLLTHPMFGPDSSKDGFEDLPIVLDKFKMGDEDYNSWRELFEKKGLRVVELTAKEHDELAANSQGVTHFLGRVLEKFALSPTPIDTLGAKKLQQVMQQTCNDTWQLFRDLQNYNEYTSDMRIRFGKAYESVYNALLPERVSDKGLIFGIQGGKGSFNEQALMDYVTRHDIAGYKVKYLYTTEKVLQSLEKGEIDFGQFAIENSVGGLVDESIKAMANFKFDIAEEFAIIISHFLMKQKGVETEKVDTIMTHPQVLKQCKTTLEKKYPELEKTSGEGDLIDHANVAKAMNQGKMDENIAVMGPEILADLYDLEIIEGNLQDNKENFTSFLMVERTS